MLTVKKFINIWEKMPSKKYNLVQNPGDDMDSRIPLVPDEAFQHGIHFNVKVIQVILPLWIATSICDYYSMMMS